LFPDKKGWPRRYEAFSIMPPWGQPGIKEDLWRVIRTSRTTRGHPLPGDAPLTKAEKAAAGLGAFTLIGCCGPVIFVLVFFLLVLVIVLPLEFTIGAPGWLYYVLAASSGLITVVGVSVVAVGRVKEERRRKFLRRAEMRRAEDALKED
jgi:hypothetical protein